VGKYVLISILSKSDFPAKEKGFKFPSYFLSMGEYRLNEKPEIHRTSQKEKGNIMQSRKEISFSLEVMRTTH